MKENKAKKAVFNCQGNINKHFFSLARGWLVVVFFFTVRVTLDDQGPSVELLTQVCGKSACSPGLPPPPLCALHHGVAIVAKGKIKIKERL